MGEKVLKVKTVSDVADAISGLTDLQGSLKGVGTAAFEAAGKSKAQWQELEAEWQKSNPTLKGIVSTVTQVESALNQMGRAATASQLEAGLVKSQVALNQFKAKIEEVRAAGGSIDEGMKSSLAVMESAIDAGKEKLVAMKDATTKAREELGLLGDEGKKAGQQIEAGAKDAWTELEKLGVEGKDAANALRALENSTSARELARNAGLAAFHVEELTGKLKAAGPAGDKVAAAMKAAEVAIGSAADKAGRMKDVVGDLGERSKMAGDKLQTLQGSVGSLDGMFGRMRDTGSGAAKVIGNIGVGAGIAAAGIMGAVAAGKQLAQFIDEVDAWEAKRDRAATDAKVKAQLLDAANRAVTRGLVEQGKTTDETIKRYVEMTVRMGRLTEQGRAYIATLAGMKAPAAWSAVEEKAKAMADTLVGAYKRSEEEGNRWALENAQTIKAVIAAYDEVGKTAPEELGKALAAAEKWAEGNRKAAESARGVGAAVLDLTGPLEDLRKAYEAASGDPDKLQRFRREVLDSLPAHQASAVVAKKNADEILAEAAAYEGSARAADDAANAVRDNTTAAELAKKVAEGWGTDLDMVAKGIQETGGQLVVGTPITISYTQATQEMTDALLDAAVASKALRAEQAQALDATKGWTDYVLTLKNGYDSGVTSLGSYIQELIRFKSQITQMFAGATGDAKEAVTALQDLIEGLIANIGTRDPGTGNRLLDELNRSVAAAAERRKK